MTHSGMELWAGISRLWQIPAHTWISRCFLHATAVPVGLCLSLRLYRRYK